MSIAIGRTKDGHPAVKISHLTYAMLPGRSGGLAIFSKWPAKDPAECVAADFTSCDKTIETEAEFTAHVQELADHFDEVSRLGRTEIRGSIPSYWGPTQTRKQYYPGIESVTTAGHGGFILSDEMNELVDHAWRNDDGNYEEDSCWAKVAFTFPHLFTQREMRFANKELINSYPDIWERLTGKTILPGESRSRDEAAFLAEHAQSLVVTSAITSKKYEGFVECDARLGRDYQSPAVSFLVPSDEYKLAKFGFIIDEARHVRLGVGSLPHAIDLLIENITAERAEIEKMVEATHEAGDQSLAEVLASQLVDIDEVLPRLVKLIWLPGTMKPLPPESKDPNREERGMRIVYLETIKMLDGARHDQKSSRTPSKALDRQVEVLELLLTKVRSLFHCAVEDVAG